MGLEAPRGPLKGHTATVNYEGEPEPVNHKRVIPYVAKHAIDREDLRELLTALGYVPYMGIQSQSGRYKNVVREPQFTLDGEENVRSGQ